LVGAVSGTAPLVGLLWAGCAAGVVLLAVALRGVPVQPTPARTADDGMGWPARRLVVRAGLAAVAAIAVAMATRWPVGALLAAAGGWALPGMFAGNAAAKASIARVEAIAVWVENLSATIAAGRGLTQAIMATAAAPEPIQAEVAELAGRLAAQEPLRPALERFADRLADPSADELVAALLMVANPRQKFGRVREALNELATAIRERVRCRLTVEVGRTRMRNLARFVTLWTVGFILVQLVATPAFLAPYGSVLGQLVLVLIGVDFAAAFWLLARMSRAEVPARLLGHPAAAAEPPTGGRR
jgi:Flp pilus assembly protein TadB